MFKLEEIYSSYICCKKGKKTSNLFEFEFDIERNLINIYSELKQDNYHIHNSYVFVLIYPKTREIWAVDIKDRIVHHLIISYLQVFYENSAFSFSFLNSTFACRKGYGTHKALDYVKKYYNQYNYYLKLDISSFFVSIDRNILYKVLKDDLEQENFQNKEDIFLLLKKVIFHNYTQNYTITRNKHLLLTIPSFKSLIQAEKKNCGLPIGNLTSQFFANVYLNKLDYFIVKFLGFDSYLRYMDDFIIFSNNLKELEGLIEIISDFLRKDLNLHLAQSKIELKSTEDSLDFLGFIISKNYTLVRKKSVKESKKRIYNIISKNKYLDIKSQKHLQNLVNSYFGHFSYANSYKLKQVIYKKMDLEKYFNLEEKKDSITIKRKEIQEKFKNFSCQYVYFQNKYIGSIILIQMGYFYRIFDNQAIYLQKKLGLKLFIFKKQLCVGFAINNKKLLMELNNLNINYVLIVEKGFLPNGLKERIEKEVVLDKICFNYTYDSKNIMQEISKKDKDFEIMNFFIDLLENLDSSSPNDIYIKLHNLKKKYF